MKLEKLPNGRVLLKDNFNNTIQGIYPDVEIRVHPRNPNTILICEEVHTDEFGCINIQVTDITLVTSGGEVPFVGTAGQLIEELYTIIFNKPSIDSGPTSSYTKVEVDTLISTRSPVTHGHSITDIVDFTPTGLELNGDTLEYTSESGNSYTINLDTYLASKSLGKPVSFSLDDLTNIVTITLDDSSTLNLDFSPILFKYTYDNVLNNLPIKEKIPNYISGELVSIDYKFFGSNDVKVTKTFTRVAGQLTQITLSGVGLPAGLTTVTSNLTYSGNQWTGTTIT